MLTDYANRGTFSRELLLHTCCAPCAEYPVQMLRETRGIEPVCYFYNPNIHPLFEHERRRDFVLRFAAQKGLDLIVKDGCDEAKWRMFPSDRKSDHCGICYASRFYDSCRYAAEHGYKAFTSTLFVSPYQDTERMRDIAARCCRLFGLTFLDIDFRPGYRQGQEMARADGLYRQRYCGCIYSLGESNFRDRILKQVGLTAADLPDRSE